MRMRGNVRLCDRPGCHWSWPCKDHGTLTARTSLIAPASDRTPKWMALRCEAGDRLQMELPDNAGYTCMCGKIIACSEVFAALAKGRSTVAHAPEPKAATPVQETPAAPEREQRFKVGDRVRAIDVGGGGTGRHLKLGAEYTVDDVDSDGDVWFTPAGQEFQRCFYAHRFELADTDAAGEAPLPRGWERVECASFEQFYQYRAMHHSAALHGDGKWGAVSPKGFVGCYDTRIQAMAASLGYLIAEDDLERGYRYHKDGGSSALYRTTDEAARAACAAHS